MGHSNRSICRYFLYEQNLLLLLILFGSDPRGDHGKDLDQDRGGSHQVLLFRNGFAPVEHDRESTHPQNRVSVMRR